MDQIENGSNGDITHGHGLRRRIVFGGCIVLGVLLLSVLVSFWRHGVEQQTRVSKLIGPFESATVLAQYGEYRYESPPMTRAGEFTLVFGRGPRPYPYGVVDNPPRYLAWIVPILGESCFTHVTDIEISSHDFGDADVDLLLGFPDLRVINVSGTAIIDDGLTVLASLEELVRLDVSGTNVSQNSLRRLSRCKDLRELNIEDTNADVQVVADLKKALPNCWIRE